MSSLIATLSVVVGRISDRGGGIRSDLVKKVWNYGFTTSGETDDSRVSGGLFGHVMENRSVGLMHGSLILLHFHCHSYTVVQFVIVIRCDNLSLCFMGGTSFPLTV